MLLNRFPEVLNLVVIFLKYHKLSVSDTEVGSFILGITGEIGGGTVGMWAYSIALGPQTLGAGILLCGLIVGGAMGYAGGEAGGALGEAAGDEIYKAFEQWVRD